MRRHLVHVAAFLAVLVFFSPAIAQARRPPVPPEQVVPLPSMEQAERVFALLMEQPDIAFTYPIDGCYSRAHIMVQRLIRLGYRPGKVWAFAHGDQLYARSAHDPRGFITWGWHVAPTLPVRQDGAIVDMVIDPSLFSRPVTVPRWRDAMRRSPTSKEPYICQTRLGEPPLQPDGMRTAGSGYWRGADPVGDLDEHARGVMRRYQAIADAR